MLTCAVSENGPNNFGGLTQAFLLVVQYWGIAKFSEIQEMTIGQVIQKGVFFESIISKFRG